MPEFVFAERVPVTIQTDFIELVELQRSDRLADAGFRESANGGPRLADTIYTLAENKSGVEVTVRAAGRQTGLSAIVPEQVITDATASEKASNWWTLDLLSNYLVLGPGTPDVQWNPIVVVGNGLPTLSEIVSPPKDFQDLPGTSPSIIRRAIRSSCGSVLIDGRTGSGKSTQARTWAARSYNEHDAGVIALDLIDPADGPASVMQALLILPSRPRYHVTMESIDANPGRAHETFNLIKRLREEAGLAISVLATGWLDYEEGDARLPFLVDHNVSVVKSHPQPLFEAFLAGHALTSGQLAQVKALCGEGEDLVLGRRMREFLDANASRPPTGDEFVEHVAQKLGLDEFEGDELRKALYHFACLGMFEIDVPRSHAEHLFREHITTLTSRKLIEPFDTSYRVPSSSVARLIAQYAYSRWNNGMKLEHPGEYAVRILKSAGEAQIKATLDRLKLINRRSGIGGRASELITSCWVKRQELIQRLGTYVTREPEWQHNAASAAFAAIAMARLDMPLRWPDSAEFVRRSWNYGSGSELPIWQDERTNEAEDFTLMQTHMKKEDERRAEQEETAWPYWLRGEGIDLVKAHCTWMLGVLLCFEAAAPDDEQDTEAVRNRLLPATRGAQEATGTFYPSRIPWVTARVLIGLCEAGYAHTETANKAAAWLRTGHGPGSETEFGWRSGTGDWNSDSMTRAMCIIALQKHGAAANREAIDRGYADLTRGIETLAKPPSEIERSLFAEAYLIGGPTQWAHAYPHLDHLLNWISRDENWLLPAQQADARLADANGPVNAGYASQDGESTKLAFVTSQIVVCIWQIVENELTSLFADMEIPRQIEKAGDSAAEAHQPEEHEAPTQPEPSPVPNEQLRVADRALIQRAAENLQRVDREITRNVESRETALRNRNTDISRKPIQVQLDIWYRNQQICAQLVAELGNDPVGYPVIMQIDKIGREVIGRAWPALLSPDEYGS